MSSMEPEVKNFLAKIAASLSMGLLWLVINSTLGIRFNLGFYDDHPTAKNYIFYAWFLISLSALLFYYKKKWKL